MSIDLETHRPDPESRARSRRSRVLWALGLTLVLFGASYVGVRWLASEVSDAIGGAAGSTVAPGLPVAFEVSPGAPASQIARDLADAGVIASAAEFDREVLDQSASDRLQAGSYELVTGMEPSEVLAILLKGPAAEVYRLTVVEGLTVAQMLESISRQTDIPLEELTVPLLDGTVTSNLSPVPPNSLQDWEGLLFPDTYELASDAGAVDILERLASTAEDRVGSVDWTALEERGMTPYEGIIIASLIEREAALDEDRPLIASVIYNRLDIPMKLQIDATVIYALGGTPEGGLTLGDLEVNSPYNTYLIEGLPPTPISGVGIASLRAAAAPAETNFLFYVLIDESGKHAFTDDFDEFLRLQEEAAAGS